MGIDQSLAESAKALEAAAAEGRALAPLLEKLCPQVYRQIVNDASTTGLFSFWGRCVNIDENTGQVIVHPAILQAIGCLAAIPMNGRVVHAGLQHTYGYLFSLIETPYGFKRQRWVSEEWELCFGLESSLLGPEPTSGTLLANLTWFLGRLVFRNDYKVLRRLERIAPAVAAQLVGYDFSQIDVCRIIETAEIGQKVKRTMRLVTDLVGLPLPQASSDVMSAILIYSIQNGVQAPLKLITAFPVKEQVVRELKASVLPESVPVRLRYNAYVPGFLGRTVMGRRRMA